jgi:hypothetical protein
MHRGIDTNQIIVARGNDGGFENHAVGLRQARDPEFGRQLSRVDPDDAVRGDRQDGRFFGAAGNRTKIGERERGDKI